MPDIYEYKHGEYKKIISPILVDTPKLYLKDNKRKTYSEIPNKNINNIKMIMAKSNNARRNY